MRTFTAREIELCRELAGLWGKEVEKGDWYMDGEKGPILSTRKLHPLAVFETVFIPRLDDILREIRRMGWSIEDHYDSDGCIFISVGRQGENRLDLEQAYGATDLEAATRCLIEIIRKEGKK